MDRDDIIQRFRDSADIFEYDLGYLRDIVQASDEPLEGNAIYAHRTLYRLDMLYTKQLNLFGIMKGASSVCEIGFNAGHSALLMFLGCLSLNSTPLTSYVGFDICEHSYVKPTFECLKSKFKKTDMELVEGDSRTSVGTWLSNNPARMNAFDVFHVDGGHSVDCIRSDVSFASKLLKKGGILIVDDTNISYVNLFVYGLLESGAFEECDVFPTQLYEHRILRFLGPSLKNS